MVDMEWIASNCYQGTFDHSAVAWVRPRRLLVTLDLLAAAVAFVVASFLVTMRLGDSGARASDLIFQALVSVVTVVLLYRAGQYSGDRRMSRLSDLGALVKSAAIAFFFVSGVWIVTDAFFTEFRDQSRLLLLEGMTILFGLLALNRLVLRRYQVRLFARGEGTRKVILVGQGKAATDFMAFLEKRPWLGLRCTATMPVKGKAFSVERIKSMLKSGEVGDLVLALDPEERGEFDRISKKLDEAGLQFRVVPSLFEESLRASRVYGFRGLSVFNVDVDPLDRVQRTFKRLLDVTVAGFALLMLSPVLLVVAAAVKLDSKGPVIFRQTRLGLGGQPFQILKFRTMVVDAEARLASLKDQNEADGPLFKIKRDPRITRLGAFLRKTSLDEFPQFVNVLKGDMSVVGPRPPLPREVDEYETSHLVRLKGKPGITGLWQVSGRSDLGFDEMVNLDRKYLENWSIGMDIGIILRTAAVVLAHRGAY